MADSGHDTVMIAQPKPKFMTTSITILAGLIVIIFSGAAVAESVARDSVVWYDYQSGVTESRATGKPIFLWFYGDWCGYCRKMIARTFTDSSVVRYLNSGFVPIKIETRSTRPVMVDGVTMTESEFAVRKFGVRAVPATWFLEPDGCRIRKLKGYRPASDLIINLEDVHLCRYGDCTNVPISETVNQPKSGGKSPR